MRQGIRGSELNRGRRSARRRHRVFGGRRIVATGLIAKGRDGFIERAEIEAVIHAEFNQYDMDRDNKFAEPEVRLIVQRSLQRQAAERQQIEARRRQDERDRPEGPAGTTGSATSGADCASRPTATHAMRSH